MTPDPSGPPRARGLGKGLAALLGEAPAAIGDPLSTPTDARGSGEGAGGTLRMLPLDRLEPHPCQPRRRFDADEIRSLADSIREKGMVQPLVARPTGRGRYQIVAGERRWRAAQQAGVHEVPTVVRRLSDSESLEVALVENLQRRDLDPLEEAAAYRRLIDEFHHRQEDIARALGKSRSHVANTVRLLDLPERVKELVVDGALSAGHARALLPSARAAALADEAVRRRLTVRQTEALVRRAEGGNQRTRRRKDPNTASLEAELGRDLGLKVSIDERGDGGGQLMIAYRAPEQLEALVDRLRRRPHT